MQPGVPNGCLLLTFAQLKVSSRSTSDFALELWKVARVIIVLNRHLELHIAESLEEMAGQKLAADIYVAVILPA